MSTQIVELQVQVLVEMEDGSEVTHRERNFVERAIQQLWPPSTKDIRTIVTIADEHDNVIASKFDNNPTEELRKRAWT